ncbi:hypothetical protein Neosp_004088 [[Neocosmospora] mangrovei]
MSFASLPTEVLGEVGKHCDGQPLASLAQVNRHFYAIFNPLLYQHSIANDSPSQECVRWAVEYGELNTLKYAISQGADINGSCAVTERYVHSGMSSTPLHVATANSFHEMVQWLLDNGASLHEPSFGLCGCDELGTYHSGLWYPLHFAISHSDEAMLRLFLQKGAYFSADKIPGLRCAIQEARLDIIDLLVQQPGFDPRYQDPHEQNALHYVCNVHDPSAAYQIVHRLVDHGVPMNVMVEGDTPLSQLVRRAMYKPAVALLERGADPYFDGHYQRMNVLDLCFDDIFMHLFKTESVVRELREDRRKLVAMFIAKGADVNSVTTIEDKHLSLLCRALLWGKDVELIRILLDAGASIRNAVTYTDGSKTEGLLRELFRQVADFFPRAIGVGGPSEAFFEPYKDSVRLLLEHGARIDSVDGEKSVLGICCQMATPKTPKKRPWALEFLIDNSIRQNVTLEFIEALLEKTEGEEVRELLERLRDKLAGDGENDEAEMTDE